MPYKSEAQRRKFHSMLNEGKMSKSIVDEFDKASKGKKLPERVGPKGKGVVKAKGIERLKSAYRKMK